MTYRKLHFTHDGFYPGARALRGYFDQQFADPTSVDGKRFVWDFWHVPDQYRLLRTPAYHYFPRKMYDEFHRHLVAWGRRTLGCWDISPPWLSAYVDGCFQEFHADVPHGPWAYVLSLCPTRPMYRGGETELLRPEIMSLWANQGRLANFEKSGILDSITPKFNRLTVFDGRVPHRVRRVDGPLSPEEGRLVIHGWFTRPKTYIDGFHPAARCEAALEEAFEEVAALVGSWDAHPTGTLSVFLKTGKDGDVREAKLLSNSVVTLFGERDARLDRAILEIYRKINFGRAKGPTEMVVPLVLG